MNHLAQNLKSQRVTGTLFLMLSCCALAYPVDQFADAAHELAGKILAFVGPEDIVGFKFQSLASLGMQEIGAARQMIEAELRAQNVHFSEDSKATLKIKVTLSENSRQYLWIAEIQRGESHQVVIADRIRIPKTVSKNVALRETIEARLIYEQDEPILDFRPLGQELLILDPIHLALYRRTNGVWDLGHSASLEGSHPLPRDIRGRLTVSGDTIQARIPGLSCSGTIWPYFSLNCSSETNWPLEPGAFKRAPDANYFVSTDLPPFFSASSVKDDGSELWVIAAVDGHTYLFDGTSKIGTLDGWGDDIAGVDSECGTGHQIIAVLPGDALEPGVIQAFEIIHRKSIAVSSTVEFPGPVTALWPVPGQNAVAVVSRDTKTGRYAAFSLSVSCSR